MADPYWLCALGTVVRISHRMQDPKRAARECFGMSDGVTCYAIHGRGWHYRSNGEKQWLLEQLRKEHQEKTGYTADI